VIARPIKGDAKGGSLTVTATSAVAPSHPSKEALQ
jgi:hypothetical protein